MVNICDCLSRAETVLSRWQLLNYVLNDTAYLASVILIPPTQGKRLEINAEGKVDVLPTYIGARPDYIQLREKVQRCKEIYGELQVALGKWKATCKGRDFDVFIKDIEKDLDLNVLDLHHHASREVFDRSDDLLKRFSEENLSMLARSHSEEHGYGTRCPSKTPQRRPEVPVRRYQRHI